MSQIQVDTIYNLNADGPPTLEGGAIVSGIATASIFKGDVNVGTSVTITASGVNVPTGIVTASTISADAAGGALATTINAKASTGKAIAMSMVFG
tara:strand:+ start:232 stop:516 length:285 start_codon:yes stop_codon:yes gene_type:complete